jgi:choline monooxygenase
MTFMPEFAAAKNIPSASDNLPQVPFAAWANHGFAALDPAAPLEAFLGDITARLAALPVENLRPDPAQSRSYVVNAHWALYVENYLEGFHIPFVHAGLNRVVEYGSYADELFRYATLQLVLAKDGEPAFDLPASASDQGRRIAAYYAWIFPNLMLNFYPWGLSLNRVVPEAIDRTRIEFRAYVGDDAKLGRGLARCRARRRGDRRSRAARRALTFLPQRALFAHARARHASFPPPAVQVHADPGAAEAAARAVARDECNESRERRPGIALRAQPGLRATS